MASPGKSNPFDSDSDVPDNNNPFEGMGDESLPGGNNPFGDEDSLMENGNTKNPFGEEESVGDNGNDVNPFGEEEEASTVDQKGKNPFDGDNSSYFTMSSGFASSEESGSTETAPKPIPQSPRLQAILMNRGAFIQGLGPSRKSPERNHVPVEKDVENGSSTGSSGSLEPPDSDYASQPPRSVWQSSFGSIRTPGIPRTRRAANIVSFTTKRKKSTLLLALGGISLILIGAIVGVSVAVSSKKKNQGDTAVPLTERQQELNEVVYSVSDKTAIETKGSVQYHARQWFLFEDKLWIEHRQSVSYERVVQRYVLAVFYFSTNGQDSWIGNNWLQGDECGAETWMGLNCNDNFEVRTLAFENFGLVGELPGELGHLAKLENLVIKDEKIGGMIPSSLGHLTRLRQLGLYRNELVGSIPPELFRATNLDYVNLQNNRLVGAIPVDVQFCSRLKTLVLTDNKLDGEIPFESLAATPIRYLGLGGNAFSGPLSEFVGAMSRLEYLYLDRNRFSGELPVGLSGLTNLKALDLDDNEFSGAVTVPFNYLTKLQRVSMANNRLSGAFPKALAKIPSIQTLNLSGNNFFGPLPDISQMDGIVNLFLQQNGFSGVIHGSFSSSEKLEVLFLSSNKLTGVIPSFAGSTRLRGLYLSDNQIGQAIPSTLCDLTNLEALFLDQNALIGAIPSCFGDLTKLRQLYLFKNLLIGSLPPELGSLSYLDGIGIEETMITGTVPQEVCSLASSQNFDFWSDCGGSLPELSCSCCTRCCLPSGECE